LVRNDIESNCQRQSVGDPKIDTQAIQYTSANETGDCMKTTDGPNQEEIENAKESSITEDKPRGELEDTGPYGTTSANIEEGEEINNKECHTTPPSTPRKGITDEKNATQSSKKRIVSPTESESTEEGKGELQPSQSNTYSPNTPSKKRKTKRRIQCSLSQRQA
jgi:hypothetical protein